MEHTSTILRTQREDMARARDNEITMAHEVGGQYITDHNDKQAFRDLDRRVNRLARAWDKMLDFLDKAIERAEAIESSCDNFYGD